MIRASGMVGEWVCSLGSRTGEVAIELMIFALRFANCGFGAGDEEGLEEGEEERCGKATRGVGVECSGQESCAGDSELGNKS